MKRSLNFPVNITRNPTQVELKNIQKVLDGDRHAGIVDIFSAACPFYLAAFDADSIVGVAAMSLNEESAELYKLYVAPAHRRKRIGEALFREALDVACEKGKQELLIEIAGNSATFWGAAINGLDVNKYSDCKFSVLIKSGDCPTFMGAQI